MKSILTILIFLFSFQSFSQIIRFMAGIEKDLSSERQCDIVRKALPKHKIVLYRRGEYKRLIKDSYRDTERDTSCVIILFSAGCKSSYDVITSVLCDVWLVEPHYSYALGIRESIRIGFPRNRIILGPTKERGLGVVKGCRLTPKGLGHFDSLRWVCGLIGG